MPSPDAVLRDVAAYESGEEAADDDDALSDTNTSDSDTGCDNPPCSYGPGGTPGSDIGISLCEECKYVYACELSLYNGKHKIHKRRMRAVIESSV